MWVRKGGLETVDERRKGRGESWIGASVWIMAVPMGTGKGRGRVGRRLEARQARRTRASTRQGWGLRSGGREGDARGGLPGRGQRRADTAPPQTARSGATGRVTTRQPPGWAASCSRRPRQRRSVGVSNERQIRVGAAGPPQAGADASPLVLPAAAGRLTVVDTRMDCNSPVLPAVAAIQAFELDGARRAAAPPSSGRRDPAAGPDGCAWACLLPPAGEARCWRDDASWNYRRGGSCSARRAARAAVGGAGHFGRLGAGGGVSMKVFESVFKGADRTRRAHRRTAEDLDRPETAERPRSRRPRRRPLDHDALDLVDGYRVRRPVVELRRLRRRVPGDPLRVLERPPVRQVRRDPRRPGTCGSRSTPADPPPPPAA